MPSDELLKRIDDLELLVDHILLGGYAQFHDEYQCIVGVTINDKKTLLENLRELKK